MIKFIKGDLLNANVEALVNTVNIVGVMGKGIALQFKESFPYNNKIYIEACKKNELQIGNLLCVRDSNLLLGEKLIINFPTKKHWRNPSKYEYIESGLKKLSEIIISEKIKSIAIPPLGCGNGGLDWTIIKSMIIKYLGELPISIFIYEPNLNIKIELQKKDHKLENVNLTTARAQLLYALFSYESQGEYSSLFSANKLAYFLQRMGQPLKLQFQPKQYGPYSIGVSKVLYAMNGKYLKGLEQQEAKPFESLQLNYEKWYEVKEFCEQKLTSVEMDRLNKLIKFINGFTSELSLEILSTTAYIMDNNTNCTFDKIMLEINNWSSRKAKLFKEEYVKAAYEHLITYQNHQSS